MLLKRYNTLDQFAFHHTLSDADGVSIVFFTKSGCPSCGHWRQLLDQLLKKRLDIRVFEVNAERDQALAQEFGIFHLPALFVFRAGHYYGELQCEARLDTVSTCIDDALSQPPQDMP